MTLPVSAKGLTLALAVAVCMDAAAPASDPWLATAKPSPPMSAIDLRYRLDHRPHLYPDIVPPPLEGADGPRRPKSGLSLVPQMSPLAPITATAWSPDSRLVMAGAMNGVVETWNTNGEVIERKHLSLGFGRVIYALALSRTRAVAESWGAVDPDGAHIEGYEYRWALGSGDAFRMKWVDPPASVQRMTPAERLAFLANPAAHPPKLRTSPNGRWRLDIEPRLSTPILTSLTKMGVSVIGANAVLQHGTQTELQDAIARQSESTEGAEMLRDGFDASRRPTIWTGPSFNPDTVWVPLSPDRHRAAWFDTLPRIGTGGQPTGGQEHTLLTFNFRTTSYGPRVPVGGRDRIGWLNWRKLLVWDAAGKENPLLVDTTSGVVRTLATDCGAGSAGAKEQAGVDWCSRIIDAAAPRRTAKIFAHYLRAEGTLIVDRSDSQFIDESQELFRLYQMPGRRRFITVDPYGRYDTNFSADTQNARWVVADTPGRSFAPQTFMRDYYQPGLMLRWIECAKSPRADCAEWATALPAVKTLNRVLPVVTITGVHPSATPGLVDVAVEARDGFDSAAANGKTRSGLDDLRVLRDGRLVDQWPGPRPGVEDDDKDRWREANRLTRDPDSVVRHTFTVRVPTGPAGTDAFSAYAFNEDRVKSDTATVSYLRPATRPGPRRAFVLSIGVNDYDNPGWDLRFAAQDATLMNQTLKVSLPDYDVRTQTLLGNSPTRQASLGLIHDALTLLGRTDGARGEPTTAEKAAARKRLTTAGVADVNVASFETATPDDIVIITFAGHGWTSDKGEFYLVPSDGKVTPDGKPNPFTFISAAQLTDWLRPVDAGEMVIVIDACHSAASVQAAGFKPAPLGDPGLGQLAFDKGIRILAASQADAVAMEDEGLRHGLLTYALTQEALGGAHSDDAAVMTLKAGLFRDGAVTLDGWLTYAARRLPSLSETLADARQSPPPAAGDIVFDPPAGPKAAAAPAQEPQLFDFTGGASGVVLTAASGGRS